MRVARRDPLEALPQQDLVGSRGRPPAHQKGNFQPMQLMFWEEVGKVGTQAIFDAFC